MWQVSLRATPLILQTREREFELKTEMDASPSYRDGSTRGTKGSVAKARGTEQGYARGRVQESKVGKNNLISLKYLRFGEYR